jgi:hypothetical protein
MTNYQVIEESTPQPDGSWQHRCGTTLLLTRVHHPVWDGLSPCSGTGEVRIEKVPYCPSCQTRPGPFGAPVYE